MAYSAVSESKERSNPLMPPGSQRGWVNIRWKCRVRIPWKSTGTGGLGEWRPTCEMGLRMAQPVSVVGKRSHHITQRCCSPVL